MHETKQVKVRIRGPLAVLAAGFDQHLDRLRYAPLSAQRNLYQMAYLSRWLQDHGLGAEEVNDDRVAVALCLRFSPTACGKSTQLLIGADALGHVIRRLPAALSIDGGKASGCSFPMRPFRTLACSVGRRDAGRLLAVGIGLRRVMDVLARDVTV
jgi:hypothetical protein